MKRKQLRELHNKWLLFVESVYNDKPRLKNYLRQAEIKDKDCCYEIAIPVHNELQETWLISGPLDEIKQNYESYTGYSRNDFDIVVDSQSI